MSFSNLSRYKRVLVTGPQRSGTRIASKMIAHDANLRFVREEEFSVHSEKMFDLIVTREFNIVVQCPGMCHIIERYSAHDTLIVMMIRDVEDIIASEQRIGWDHGYFRELLKLGIPHSDAALRDARREGVRPSELKYEMWQTQKEVIENYMELEFESLSSHPLWIPKEDRADFKETQTR